MDTETRKIMWHHGAHYRKAAPEKLYLPVEEGWQRPEEPDPDVGERGRDRGHVSPDE